HADRTDVIERAGEAGVGAIIVPAVERANFDTVAKLAHSFKGGMYALGIHPLYVPNAQDEDLDVLEEAILGALDDPRFIGVGEIGLDYFVPALTTPEMAEKQERFLAAQLRLAQRHSLPVILHVRRSQDRVLKYLRNVDSKGGSAHAFNGSFQQAQQFIDLGFALGFGGAMTFEGSRRIRRLAAELPIDALVLETDAPDIPPAWLGSPGVPRPRNEPAELARIARVMAKLRNVPVESL